MKYCFLIISLSVLFTGACSENDEQPSNEDAYLVFGIYHNFCVGNCWHLFKIENGQLYPDQFDHIKDGEISFSSTPLSQASFELSATLIDVPDVVVTSDEDTYGCPDCADQGGYYLEFIDDGARRVVHFDTRFDGFEETPIIDYLRKMDSVLETLIQ